MTLSWDTVRPSFREVGYPDLGWSEQWEECFNRIWECVSKAGLADAESRLDEVRVSLRAMAIVWLAHDFCHTLRDLGDEPPTLSWLDWLGETDIGRAEVLLLASAHESFPGLMRSVYADLADASDDDSAITAMLANSLCMLLADARTQVTSLYPGEQKIACLLGSFWASTCNLEVMGRERRQELEDAHDEAIDRHSRFPDDLGIQAELASADEQLARLGEDIRTEAEESFAASPILFCDEESAQRMQAWEWATSGWAVQIRGCPAYLG